MVYFVCVGKMPEPWRRFGYTARDKAHLIKVTTPPCRSVTDECSDVLLVLRTVLTLNITTHNSINKKC